MKNKINDYQVTTSLFFDKRRENKKNKFPVRLRIIFQRKAKYYSTGINLNADEYQKIFNPQPKQKIPTELKNIKNELSAKEGIAIEIIKSIPNFSFKLFDNIFYS